MIKVLVFARLRELVGQEIIELRGGDVQTVRDVWNALRIGFPGTAGFEKSLLFAVNQEFADLETEVSDGDELAIFPPVSGGESSALEKMYQQDERGDVYQIVDQVIQIESLAKQLSRPEDGAIVVFAGIVRNNSLGRKTLYLEYQAYESMASRKMREIGFMIQQRWGINRIGIVHRLGKLEIGETSIAIVITAAHRHVAFEACHDAIDTLKKTVPIWKKEFFEDGEVWVEGDTNSICS